MTHEQVNDRYLTVGYRRRDHQSATTAKGRHPMGRKGIGKLSLFSIAGVIELHTIREAERSALKMDRKEIKRQIEESPDNVYEPEPLDDELVDFERGTRIILTSLKKGVHTAASYLRTRIARRFSVLGEEHRFEVYVNGERVTIEDRDYFHKLEYVWWLDEVARQRLEPHCSNAENEHRVLLDGTLPPTDEAPAETVTGWVGTARSSTDLQEAGDSINRVSIMVRGKLAQEDILEEFGFGGIYSKYLIGEVHADFLDTDDLDDIATSSRQNIIQTDPRYARLKAYLRDEITKIGNTWLDRRRKKGRDAAIEIPAIDEWFKTLGEDDKKRASKLFGSINQLPIDDARQKAELFGHGVMAFERFRHVDKLERLTSVAEAGQPELLWKLFSDLDDIEATLYHRIVRDRLAVIDRLREAVEENELEKVVQNHLFEHLWLLDPSWERATGSEERERTVLKAFEVEDAELTDDEKMGRLDIKYRTTAGRHVIVELKRPNRSMKVTEIYEQCEKYLRATEKVLRQSNVEPVIEIVCVLGVYPKGWEDAESRERHVKSLQAIKTRVMFYQELFDSAYSAYQEYLDARKKLGRLERLLDDITRDVIAQVDD
jgi:hypothetical protein